MRSLEQRPHVRVELNERVYDVRTHEAVSARDEHRPIGKLASELTVEDFKVLRAPRDFEARRHHIPFGEALTCPLNGKQGPHSERRTPYLQMNVRSVHVCDAAG